MIRRKLTVLVMCIMSLNLVACSNTDNTQISKEQIEENTVSSEINKEKDLFDEVEINKEKELFDKAVIIADDDIARVKITGKEKVTPGNSIGYIFSISNDDTSIHPKIIWQQIVATFHHKHTLHKIISLTFFTFNLFLFFYFI